MRNGTKFSYSTTTYLNFRFIVGLSISDSDMYSLKEESTDVIPTVYLPTANAVFSIFL